MKLEEVLGRPVAKELRRPYAYRTSSPLDVIEVVLDDGSRLELVYKDLRRTALEETALLAKPEFLHDPAREIAAYRLLEPHRLGTPAVYGYGKDWLLLEKVEGVELYQVGDLDTWCQAARWLARLHGVFAGAPPDSPHLLHYDEHFYRIWAERARRFTGDVLDGIVSRYDTVVRRLCELPVTFVHGELYASNVLVARDRIASVDWEMAAVGPGLVDLAALTSGLWTDAERNAIVAAYGDVDAEALECCRLHIALQWLGWSAGWTPPAEHAFDWLTEAVRAGTRLGLEP